MIQTLALLLGCQLLGEAISRFADLPVPGPVIGMILLLALFAKLRDIPENVEKTSFGLLEHLSLLFIPAGTGVMLHFERINEEWLPVTVALVGSTIVGLLVTAGLFTLFLRLTSKEPLMPLQDKDHE